MDTIKTELTLQVALDDYVVPQQTVTIQGDFTSRTVEITLKDGATTYAIGDDEVVYANFVLPDGSLLVYSSDQEDSVISVESNKITLEITQAVATVVGIAKAEISVVNATDEAKVTSEPFKVVVTQAVANYYTNSKTDVIAELKEGKQDKLTAGDGIAITNNVISATGGGSGGTSNYNQLTNKPKINNVELSGNKTLAQLGINNFSGNYNDLSNKPTIPSISGLATESYVNNAVSGKADVSSVPTKTSQLTNDSDYTTTEAVATQLDTKQDTITSTNKLDYSLIANQPTIPSLDGYATKTYVDNHHDNTKADVSAIPTVPTNVSAFTNDSGYLTLATLPTYNGEVI